MSLDMQTPSPTTAEPVTELTMSEMVETSTYDEREAVLKHFPNLDLYEFDGTALRNVEAMRLQVALIFLHRRRGDGPSRRRSDDEAYQYACGVPLRDLMTYFTEERVANDGPIVETPTGDFEVRSPLGEDGPAGGGKPESAPPGASTPASPGTSTPV